MNTNIHSSSLLFVLLMSFGIVSTAQDKNTLSLNWSIQGKIPAAEGMTKQLGLAGVFAGVHNGVMIIAGGANFPDAMPWKGGKKLHRDDIYVLTKNTKGKIQWIKTITKHLPEPVAYGVSISLPEGIFCAGGETEKNGISKNVFLMQWNEVNKEVIFKPLPSLPVPLANACITNIGKTLFIAGGETGSRVSDAFYSIDLSAQEPQWQQLPSLPNSLSHSVAVAQKSIRSNDTCVYIMGGRCSTPSGISNLYSSVFCYDPTLKKWDRLHPISDGKNITNLSAATGIIVHNGILLVGGDKGNIFHSIETYNAAITKTESSSEKQRLQSEKEKILIDHPGFNKDVFFYDLLHDSWKKIGELPFYAPVTTTLVNWDGEIWIPSGEIKPGIRTPDILTGKIIIQ